MALNFSNITQPEHILAAANTQTGGWFWVAMWGMLYAILFISMLGFGFWAALLGGSFAALMMGILLVYMGLVSWTWVAMAAGIIVLSFLMIQYSRRD